MKKILLGLFLILGAISFSAPSHVNTAKIKSDGHTILDDKSDSYAFGERIDENSLLVVTYYVGELGPGGVKTVSETLKNKQLVDGMQYVGSGESEIGYIHKLYASQQGYYFYIIIGKKQPIKNYVITSVFQTTEEYSSKNDLKEIINLGVGEGRKYLK